MEVVLGLLAGLILGAMAAVWWSRARGDASLSMLRDERAAKEAEVVDLSAQLAGERERNTALNERLLQQKQETEQLHQRMTDQFKLIANELLETKGRQLGREQHERLDLLLKPLNERINDFKRKVEEAYEKEGRERFALKNEIMRLVEQNQKLSQDADNLTRALKGESKTQGDWGEMVLEHLLENSGLVKGEEYILQQSTTLNDGSRLRPDAVVKLPGDRCIVIDAKVSLTHYERYMASSDDGERERMARAHAESMRAHVKGLEKKDYSRLYGITSPDFVLMFVPIEASFHLAQATSREIAREAIEQRVFIVTHSTLLASLRLFHGVWKTERIARDHQLIVDRAGELYEKFVGFTEDLLKVGNQLKLAKGSYDEAMNKLSEGRGNLVRQVEMLKELGAKTNKTIQPALLQRAREEEQPTQA